jgi:hypothetical protein
MEVIVILLVIGVLWFFLQKMGKLNFWQVVSKHPEKAWLFFNQHPSWHIADKPIHGDFMGPYKVQNPLTGHYVNVYCESKDLESSQKEFLDSFQ